MANASEASHGSATRPDPEDVIRVRFVIKLNCDQVFYWLNYWNTACE